MARKSIVLTILVVLTAAFVDLTQPIAVRAACTTYAGSYDGSTHTQFVTSQFQVSAGNVITLTLRPSKTVIGVIALIRGPNGFQSPLFGGPTATSAQGSIVAPISGLYDGGFIINQQLLDLTMHWTITIGTDCDNGVTQLTFTDGRVNSHDGQETAAVYCNENGGVDVWTVIDSVGYFAFTATRTDLARVPEKPRQNTLIKSSLGVALYRLTSGELQINSANDYVFIWDGCPTT